MDSSEAGMEPPAADAELPAQKATLRSRLVEARARLPREQRDAAARRIRDALLSLPEAQMAGTVAAYFSVGTEPDSRGLVYALWKRGAYVLLPLLLPDGDLDWASYEGPDSLTAGPRGLLQPAAPPRGPATVARADLVIVPALAADQRGYRLGRGLGCYDRALARVGPQVLTVALLYDGELLPGVPAEAHDQRVRAVAQPAGITRLRPALPYDTI
jgi:5-formyltetrahydrofolate cyclo-ligase